MRGKVLPYTPAFQPYRGNLPYGMIGRVEETSASFEARSAPRCWSSASAICARCHWASGIRTRFPLALAEADQKCAWLATATRPGPGSGRTSVNSPALNFQEVVTRCASVEPAAASHASGTRSWYLTQNASFETISVSRLLPYRGDMDTRVGELAFLAMVSAGLCVAALIYEQRLATTIFAALTSGAVVIAAGLQRRRG
jgi:hypothetical protein